MTAAAGTEERGAAERAIPVVRTEALDFSYGRLQVLFQVDLAIWPGEVVGLLGTNGAGKSTLLKNISGLVIPRGGRIYLNGADITASRAEARVRAGIVHVPGERAVFPSLTVADNLAAGTYTFRRDRARVRHKTDEVLRRFPELGERLHQRAGTLSGGETKMLALAKGLLLDPVVLLVDELSLGLAPVVVQELFRVVEGLKRDGISMVIVEQSANVALGLADRAVFMEKGTVRFEGPADELRERNDLVRAVFLGTERS